MKRKPRKPPIKVGDKVTTDYWSGSAHVVRTVTRVSARASAEYGSGFWASVDGGAACPTCGVTPSKPIEAVDSGWFKKVKQ